MKTLEQYEKEHQEQWDAIRKSNEPHPNGIACPKCGKELWDTNPMMVLTSNPPKKNIHCPACGYVGYALI